MRLLQEHITHRQRGEETQWERLRRTVRAACRTQNAQGTKGAPSQLSQSQQGAEENKQAGSRKVLQRPLLTESNIDPAAKGENVVLQQPRYHKVGRRADLEPRVYKLMTVTLIFISTEMTGEREARQETG